MKKLGVLGLSLLLCLGVVKVSFAAATDTCKIMVVVVSENIAINIVNEDTNLFSVLVEQTTVSTWDKRIIVKNIGVDPANWSLQATNFSNEKEVPDDVAWTLQEGAVTTPIANQCRLMGIFIPYVAPPLPWPYVIGDFGPEDIIQSTAPTFCSATVHARVGDDAEFKGFAVGTGEDGERTLCLGFAAPPATGTSGLGQEMFSTLTITAAAL